MWTIWRIWSEMNFVCSVIIFLMALLTLHLVILSTGFHSALIIISQMKRTQRTSSVLFQNSHKFTRNQQRTNISFSLCVFALNIHLRTPPLSDRWANSAWTDGSWLWWTPDGWSPAGSRPPVLPPSVLLSSLLRLLLWWAEEAGARGCRWSWRTSDKSGRPIGWGTAGRWWCVADSANRRWRRRRQERRRAEIWATWGEKTWTTMIWHHSRHILVFWNQKWPYLEERVERGRNATLDILLLHSPTPQDCFQKRCCGWNYSVEWEVTDQWPRCCMWTGQLQTNRQAGLTLM